MNAQPRDWKATEASRDEGSPLLVGLMGPSGGGKTFSALRLAKGIQSVVGGDVYGIDTEQNRMLHYADDPDLCRGGFKFKHVPFRPPFGSLDYLEVLRWAVEQGGKTIIVDSMSHEHAGEGGYLELHDAELDRFVPSKDDYAKRDRNNMRAWIEPAKRRQKLIQGMLQLDANFVFTFRAKEKTKPVTGGGIVELGWMPIAGEEFVFEMTVCCLLMPAAGGVPTWQSAMPGEKMMMKPAKQFAALFDEARPLDEEHGAGLARWARGEAIRKEATKPTTKTIVETEQDADWDHFAWAKGFEENLALVASVGDLDAVRGDDANKRCFAILTKRAPDRAKALSAAITGRRKALADRETAL